MFKFIHALIYIFIYFCHILKFISLFFISFNLFYISLSHMEIRGRSLSSSSASLVESSYKAVSNLSKLKTFWCILSKLFVVTMKNRHSITVCVFFQVLTSIILICKYGFHILTVFVIYCFLCPSTPSVLRAKDII